MPRGMVDRVQEILDKLAKENPPRIIEGEELGRLYVRFNKECDRIRREYDMKEARFEVAAARAYITC